MVRLITIIVLVWLLVGAIAAGQRGYYTDTTEDCAGVGTIVVTVLAGPLNYAGVNPKVSECNVPQPSQ
ncbi:hypothetical protein [Rhodococcus maanshanensis]|uniref:hypothetical protein n=1 Tax=Rhodococcus maanshanensis TaxID=183556 RepID=UPI0009351C7F|nr:hypothetical protein [Rhodococcus maanshanensis]